MYIHVPRAALPRRTRAARQPAVPARLGAGAPGLHAQDAEPAEPGRIRPARLGPRLAPARQALLLRFALAAGVRPQPQEPCREGARRLRARARERGFFSSRRRHTISVSAFLLNRSSD